MSLEILSYPETNALLSPAQKLVVFLHGLGSDGNDLISLAPMFQKSWQDCHFISPHGVEEYDMAPFGRQWFSLRDRSDSVMLSMASKAAPYVRKIISDKQQELGIGNKDTIIIGFSQGAMMGIYLTLIQESNDPFFCTIGYSGRLIPPQIVTNKSTPILIIHGEDDDIVPASEADIMYSFFQKNQIISQKMIVPNLMHSIDYSGIRYAIDFVSKASTL